MNDLHYSLNFVREINSKRMRLPEHVACMVERNCFYGELVVKPEGKKTLGKFMLSCEDNIKMDLQEVGRAVSSWLRIGTGGGHCECG
jgi:hypothetical protein